MKYDFDEIIDRSGTRSYKWDIAEGELPMWVADMDFKTAPEVIEAIVKRAQHGVFGYTDTDDRWREAYINHWRQRHGVEYKKEYFIFSTGVIPTISSCVRKLTTAAENVVIMTPVYNVFYNCIKNNGRNVLEVPLAYSNGAYEIDFAALENALSQPQTTLMLLCNPHNPIGKIWSAEELRQIGALCKKWGVTVIADEIHCDLTDPECGYVPFASLGEECADNCVVCISPTKAFNLAGIKTSAAVVPNARLRHKVWRALNTDEVAEPNAFAVDAAIAAFERGGQWLDELRQYIFDNKKLVAEFLENELPKIRLVPSNATYLLWLDCTALGLSSNELAKFIRAESGLYLSSGAQYGGEGFLRLNIACPRAMVRDGLGRLKASIDKLEIN